MSRGDNLLILGFLSETAFPLSSSSLPPPNPFLPTELFTILLTLKFEVQQMLCTSKSSIDGLEGSKFAKSPVGLFGSQI